MRSKAESLRATFVDEVKATLGYDSAGNVTSTTVANGTGTLSATEARTYDAVGNSLLSTARSAAPRTRPNIGTTRPGANRHGRHSEPLLSACVTK